ncbi:hypothetical protein A2755_02495 [Candidatus Wolfebacteria bacterium RIFCSPHIGHO2_01_FULL_48_22]|uniref:AAA+ ATPase domain-containing protein n=2 Tax=Candidatus Wolfeibacteriota TaxID=1752735 RepID=A0A1F8DSA4_9BACT|nr:MAG: hypothetical protein A2755_02495 [Candidatus Wolfebacteria bacterium RIFCSPHIGHO2_01_FULL_48_22]OGM92340.1 MAG: hypothetical protein A2935_00575 [Candidatus Wolfebacteria bacterium RIFCSPLOWO2_01_FULL_47_17b]
MQISHDKLKDWLKEQGLITDEQFREISDEAGRMNQDVLELLISKGFVAADFLYNFIARYFGVERASLRSRGIDQSVLLLVDEKLAQEKKAVAFAKEQDGTIDIAMEDPSDLQTIEFLEKKLNAKLRIFLASSEDLASGFSLYSHAQTEDFKKVLETSIQKSLRYHADKAEDAAKEVSIVDLVNNLLSYATYLGASDVHIEAMEQSVLVRFRIDGILHEIITIPRQIHAPVVARVKLLGALKVDEHQKPQDGRFRYQVGGSVIDVRISIIPTLYGEKIVMRLLSAAQRPLSLAELGFSENMADLVEENIKKTYGMVLVTGPTGSGKTTTLYSILNLLNRPEVNIVTIEDPIEYNIRYINQIQVNPLAGITFASGLRSILRQDPNIIMVGEIRDNETADIAVQSALTGHIVLSSLHTNDAPSTVARMLDMDIPPFLAAAVLNVAVAQRLVRKICIDCIESYELSEEFKKELKNQFEELKLPNAELPKSLYRGKGCKACHGIGYRGRLGIFEIMEINDDMRRTIASPDFTMDHVYEIAKKNGMKTMFEDGLQKAAVGVTTIEEVLRVIRE